MSFPKTVAQLSVRPHKTDFIDYLLEKRMEENIQVYSALQSNSNLILPVNFLHALGIALCNH